MGPTSKGMEREWRERVEGNERRAREYEEARERLLVDACVGLNWLLVSFLSHVNKNIIHWRRERPQPDFLATPLLKVIYDQQS